LRVPSGSDKWIRSIKDNPAGKVVSDPEGNRWQWESDETTSRLLKKLDNDELAIEQTDIRPRLAERKGTAAAAREASPEPVKTRHPKPKRDAGGGFNPYDSSGKPRRSR
jgi:hypothetical protein